MDESLCWRKKFGKILENFEFVWLGCHTVRCAAPIALRLKIQTLLDDAEQSTGRIASLVEAVRSMAQQERAEAADIDVHEQLRSALACWITSSKTFASPSVIVYFLWRLSGCFIKDSPIFWMQSQL